MPDKKTKLTIGGLLYVLLFAGSAETISNKDRDSKCRGVERWNVKVMVDADAGKVYQQSGTETIEHQNTIQTEGAKSKDNNRADFELQAVTIKDVLISKILKENDNDYHLVLEDGKGNHMIGETPDPECEVTGSSEGANNFSNARAVVEKHNHDYRHYRFTVTGVLFKDRGHGQIGVAKNNLEIHPILQLQIQAN